MTCAAPSASSGLVRGLLEQADCHAQALALGGHAMIAGPHSLAQLLLQSLLVLYVAFQGWALLLGHRLSLGNLTTGVLRVGFVLALVTQWPVYDHLLFKVLMTGPPQISQTLLAGYAEAAGAPADPVLGLERAYDELRRSAALASKPRNSESENTATTAPAGAVVEGQTPSATVASSAPPPPPPPEAASFRVAAFILLMSTLGAEIAGKLVLSALLAVGPLFVSLILFDRTRGLAVGWLRAGVALGLFQLLTALMGVLQLGFLGPVILRLARARAEGGVDLTQAPAAVLITSLFALAALAATGAAALIATGLTWPRGRRGSDHDQAVSESVAANLPATPLSQRLPGPTAVSALARRDLRTGAGGFGLGPAEQRRDARATLPTAEVAGRATTSPAFLRRGGGARNSRAGHRRSA
jgi:type IV secretion system protein VirB6